MGMLGYKGRHARPEDKPVPDASLCPSQPLMEGAFRHGQAVPAEHQHCCCPDNSYKAWFIIQSLTFCLCQDTAQAHTLEGSALPHSTVANAMVRSGCPAAELGFPGCCPILRVYSMDTCTFLPAQHSFQGSASQGQILRVAHFMGMAWIQGRDPGMLTTWSCNTRPGTPRQPSQVQNIGASRTADRRMLAEQAS